MKNQQSVTISEEEYKKLKLNESLLALYKLKGSSKRKITEEEYERAREEAAQEICKKFK
jgi:hypothetical protein